MENSSSDWPNLAGVGQNYATVFFALTASAIAASSITYLLIEQPAIRFGNRLLRRRTEQQPMATSVIESSAARVIS